VVPFKLTEQVFPALVFVQVKTPVALTERVWVWLVVAPLLVCESVSVTVNWLTDGMVMFNVSENELFDEATWKAIALVLA